VAGLSGSDWDEIENGSGGVVVSVTNRGGSILEEKMEQIFESFFTTNGKGIGLSLSVFRTIIAAHRGKRWATNNPDRGATFHLSLSVSSRAQRTVPNQ
jgi:two-component system, LuxR family, sensor kinase FixL